jgi:ADP-heptose:LPS heptosyltransferase
MPPRRSAPRKLILENGYATGDIVVLTAAVRDLHLTYPGRFLTDVRTPSAEIWHNNPYLTPLEEGARGVKVIHCRPTLIQRSNQSPCHYLQSYSEDLNDQLGLRIAPTAFHGDLHLSELERSWYSQVHERTGEDTPFWIIAAGGKRDVTIKWWSKDRHQEVVDHFRDRIQFVQVGELKDHHPPLDGVIDLRGQTDLRQLIRLMYHAQGTLCGVTCLMHLAAAIPRKDTGGHDRPCVVVAGGREPPHWEAYPSHQFIHTVGQLPCSKGGCWRSRVRPLGDGDERDGPDQLCLDVAPGDLPRCMDLISARDVIRRIEAYFDGGAVRYLTDNQARAATRAITRPPRPPHAFRSKSESQSESESESQSVSVSGSGSPPASDSARRISPSLPDRVTLVSLHDEAMAEVARVTGERLREYACKHRYPLVTYDRVLDPTRHPAWSKVQAVRNALLSRQSDWVLWLDADVLLMDLDFPAVGLLDVEPDIDLICASDHNGLNTGVFLIRHGDWALRFLDAVDFLGELPADPDGYGALWEQSTFKHLIRHFPGVARRVKILPQQVMNSSVDSYRHGDFIVHLSGLTNGERLEALARLQDPAGTMSPPASDARPHRR